MNHRLLTISFICVLVLLSATSAFAQIAMAEGNAQRSRVLPTASVDAPPKKVLWSSPRLFQIRETEYLTGQNGPFRLSGDFATGQYFTTPIVSDRTLILTAWVNNAYFYVIDAITGKQLVTLQFERNEISAPAVLGQLVFFGTQTGKIFAYDLIKRAPVWFYEQKGSSFAYSEPAIDDGVVYICGSESGLFAFAADTGALKWTFKIG